MDRVVFHDCPPNPTRLLILFTQLPIVLIHNLKFILLHNWILVKVKDSIGGHILNVVWILFHNYIQGYLPKRLNLPQVEWHMRHCVIEEERFLVKQPFDLASHFHLVELVLVRDYHEIVILSGDFTLDVELSLFQIGEFGLEALVLCGNDFILSLESFILLLLHLHLHFAFLKIFLPSLKVFL